MFSLQQLIYKKRGFSLEEKPAFYENKTKLLFFKIIDAIIINFVTARVYTLYLEICRLIA